MNILIFSWRGPKHPNAGGAEISTHEHAKRWAKAGHKVTLFTSFYKGAKKEEIIDNVNIIRRGSQVFCVQIEVAKWYLFGNHLEFDVVIDQFHGIPFFTPLFIKSKKIAFIHEVTKEVWALNPWSKPFNLIPTIIGTFFEPLVFKVFYKNIPFMTVSESTKKDLIKWGIAQDKITIIHNGFNFLKVPKVKKEKKKTLIFLGALGKDKGIEDALRTFALIDRHEQGWQFWVIGKSDIRYLKKLKMQCKILNIDKKVKFWGFVSENKKFELLSKSHIIINPSIREGWGLVVIEAASVGVPTVAFNVPGLSDSIIDGHTGIICSNNKVENLAGSILKLIKDGNEYKKMSSNAIIWSKNFSWGKSANKSLKFLKNIAGKSHLQS